MDRYTQSERLRALPPYLFAELDRMTQEQLKKGVDIISLGIGDPDFPTTCSAASAVAVIYENGVRLETINGKGAELVLVDSGIIARAPNRLLASGMGDALAKWYEGKPIYDRMTDPDQATAAAMTLSTQPREIVLKLGLEAMKDVGA